VAVRYEIQRVLRILVVPFEPQGGDDLSFQRCGELPESLFNGIRKVYNGEEDRPENEYSLKHGLRLLSSYQTSANETICAVTESDRSVTTLLLPSEC
jgi:hypothetical protein